MSPLDRLAAGRIPFDHQWSARIAICTAVRHAAVRAHRPDLAGEYLEIAAVGARWRRGSNSWRPNTMRILRDARELETPCPNCGGEGDELRTVGALHNCPSCGATWVIGDYDWSDLGDCLRYAADLRSGDVEDANLCQRCARPFDEATYDLWLHAPEPWCAGAGCPWGGDLRIREETNPDQAGADARAPVPTEEAVDVFMS